MLWAGGHGPRRCATEQTWKLRAMPESLCFQASTFIQDSQGSGNFNLKMGFQVITKVFFFSPRWDDRTPLYLIICYLDLSLLNMGRHDNWMSIYKESSWQNQGVGIASDLKLCCFCFCFFVVLFSLSSPVIFLFLFFTLPVKNIMRL